jgi:hypothetical protein
MRGVTALCALGALGALVAGCAKPEATKREEVHNCSAISLDAPGISACLVAQYHWREADAQAAGRAQEHTLDSVAGFERDSAWHADTKKHREELASCARGGGDIDRCLEDNYGWTPERAGATADSIWRGAAPKHRDEIRRCEAQRKGNVGSCLMLYYKWDPKHALALNDSLERAKIRAGH